MITISLCMIVKNEEKVLARCLDSLKGLTDEIIIVDTGSTDGTIQTARLYGANIYQFTWTGSFADARNYSFSKASMDYIYSADADEVLDEINRERFLKLKNVLLPEIDIVQMMYCNQLTQNTVYNYDREYRPKLFKRIRQFTWVEPIHETVSLDPVVYDSEIEILHLPLKNHSVRDFQAFLAMEQKGQRLSTRLHHMYAQELFISGKDSDFRKAMPVFLKTLQDSSRSTDEINEACCILARAARIESNLHTFFTHALKSIVCGSCSEICCELGAYYEYRSEWEEAAVWYQNAAFETECILCLSCRDEIALAGLSRCCLALGNTIQALEYERIAAERKQTTGN